MSRINLCFLCGLLLLAALPAIDAEATDATKSESSGSGLQFATSGVLAQFTVTAKDESGVRRTSGGDEWIVELDGTRSITGSVVDNLDGTYQVSYTATKSGSYEASVKLAKSGGLTGSYFENVWFFYTPVKVTVDPQINMDWGVGKITPTGANYISVRWVGKVKTQYAETYTFYATTDDGARLWVDNVPLIDRWDSFCNETSATIALKANVFYNIKMEYKQITGSAFAKLSWASQSTPKEIIPSSQLFYETQAKKSPFSFIVMPNVASGPRSTAAGTGLAVATAGTAAQLTIQANDQYDNERGEGGDIFSVRVYPPDSIEAGKEGRAVHGVVVDNTDSSYSVEYTTYKSGMSTVYAALLVRGGVTATYYDNSDFTLPVKYAEGTTNLQNVQFQSVTATDNDNSVPTVESFSVRYAGFVAPTKDTTYAFKWKRNQAAAEDRVKLWVDNSLIIDQWTSLSASEPSGNIELRSAYYYDTKVDYKYVSGCTSGTCTATARLQWQPSGGSFNDITSANLYRGYNIMDSPYTVDVKPAGTCAAKSIAQPNQAAAGHSLELSTAGLQADFTITAKDLYGNLRLVGGDNFKVRLTGVDSTSGLVQDMSDGTYRVVYTATKSGTYDISVVFGASGINQSPFRMVTQPARRHLARSVPTGQALTLSTAGVLSSVTITIKDRHDNWQPDPSVVDAAVKFSMTDVATLQPTNVVQDSLGPDDIPSYVDKVSYIGPSTNAGHQISTPTDLDNPNLVLRYTVTRAGSYSLSIAGSKANDGSVRDSPFNLNIVPNVACATTSSAAGDSLSLATAGLPGTFTIQARDEYFNLRGSNAGDNFVARVRQFYSDGNSLSTSEGAGAGMNVVECGRSGAECEAHNTYSWGWTTTGGRDKPASIVDKGDGTYVVSYEATRSTTNYLWASFAVAGGLQATYYKSSYGATAFSAEGANRVVQQDQTVDFSVTSSTSTPYDQTEWSARWTGMVLPSLSETYTFYAGGDSVSSRADERVKLWVDNSLIIHSWNSLGMASTTTEPSGKIALVKDTYYEILLAGMASTDNTTDTAPFRLKWSSNNHAKSVISSARLFFSYHISNSPFELNVLPAITCAATSRVYRPALTLTTAGVMASFTVQSKDAFDNLRTLPLEDTTSFDFNIMANASLPMDDTSANRLQPSEDNMGMLSYAATTFYIGTGGYQVNYTATKRGKYNVQGQIMQPGGLFGAYYENDDLTDHGTDTLGVLTESRPYQRMDSKIDFDWAGGRPVPAPSGTGMTKDIGPSYFSARWRGMVKPEYSEVYTFSLAVDDGAKLWINDLLIIDHWYSRCSEVDGTIALMADTLYPIKLEYKQIVGNASISMSWRSRSQSKDVIDSDYLFSNTTTFNLCNRNHSLNVEPAIVCASTSSAEGAGLTGATAGKPSKFTIQSRDEYMNNRKLADSGIRPGSAAFYCDDWAHSGALQSGYTHTTVMLKLDATTASTVNDYYTGRTITLTAGPGAGQSRIISDYTGSDQVVTVYPPLTVAADASTKYSIGNYGGQWSEKCDETRTQAYRVGYPEFHVRVTPIIEGSQAPYHAAGILDDALIDSQQGSGISRLSSTEYPGGLTATYYDMGGSDDGSSTTYNPGFSMPMFSTWCTTAQPCDETIDFSHVGMDGSALKFTYGGYPEAIGSLGHIAGDLAATYYDSPSPGYTNDQYLTDSEYGVRWAGMIAPTLAGVYTFHAQLVDTTNNDDRVKLWIDNSLVIQQWNSLSVSGRAEGTFYFPAAYPSAYKISVHYKSHQNDTTSGLTLRWENLNTASTLQGVNAYSTTTNAWCGTGFLTYLCLATISTTSPYPQVFSSTFGEASENADSYIGQTMRVTTPGKHTEYKYVKDYIGVVKGTVRKASSNGTIYLDSDASTTDNFYVGYYIVLTGGTGVGNVAEITAYTGCDMSGCDPRYSGSESSTLGICDCSGSNHRSASVSLNGVATDTTTKYSIFMYRAELNSALTSTNKVATSTFSVSKGYSMVTYGRAECAEFTGTAQGGGMVTISEADISNATSLIEIQSAATLFGGVDTSGITLWVSDGTNNNIKISNVTSNNLTVALATSITTPVTCSAAAPCTITPRNTMILASDASTATDFFKDYFVQILSGTCAGQWRQVTASVSNGNYVTIAVETPWSMTSTSMYLGCTQPDSSSIYYLSKVCTENIITLQTVGPQSALTIMPGVDGEAILESAQLKLGFSPSTVWGPGFYDQLGTQGDNYPYPYEPFDRACCKALSGVDMDNVYRYMLITITSGTGRGQRRWTTAYDGAKLQLTVTPVWDTIPDSTSRYAIYKAKVDTSDMAGGATAPVIPSTRLFPLRSRYEVTYTPTVKGDYQVHATLAQGSGLDATYYDDMDLSMPVSSWTEEQIAFDIEDVQKGFSNLVPRSFGSLGLSDKQSFSVRWAGLLQLFDDVYDTTPEVFTFETGIGETDERVKLWVDNSLIIDRWETYDYLSATTFSATIALRSPYYYDVKMEYKQFAGAQAQAVLRWHCGITGSPCEDKVIIPSSNLFQAKEIMGSPFPPHEVQPAPTCAARSTVRGIPLSLATAGAMDSFTIQSYDEYDNERGDGGDTWVVRAVPYNTWDAMEPYATSRSSADCINCPRTVYGSVEDIGDSSYSASFNGTKKGSYKVLTSLAAMGGMYATYYGAGSYTSNTYHFGASRFHRSGQMADSEMDWPEECIFRNNYITVDDATAYTNFSHAVGAWRGAIANDRLRLNGVWQGTYQCQNWIKGTAQNGFCALNKGYYAVSVDDFAQCEEVTNGEQDRASSQTTTSATLRGDWEAFNNATYPDGSLKGMVIYWVTDGTWGMITAYTSGVVTYTLPSSASNPTDGKFRIYNCGANTKVTTSADCSAKSEVLSPTSWVTSDISSIVLDIASSNIDGAYDNWNIKIMEGECAGQVRKITRYVGKNRLATLNYDWSTTDSTATDAYGRTRDYMGCTSGPDDSSEYILYHESYAPGSLTADSANFGVRWAGFVKPSSTNEYTFQALISATNGVPNQERLKLWVDNSLIIDQWKSICSVSPSGTLAFPTATGQLYDIQIEYLRTSSPSSGYAASATAPAGMQPPYFSLRWKNEQSGSDATLSEAYDYHTLTSSRLYTNYPVPNSRVLDLQVADTCASVSTVGGNGLTAATAGSEASFTITARDSFANDRELEEDSFVVGVDGPNDFNLNVYPVPSPSSPGTYAVSYIATESGTYTISVRRASAGGLMGEYFNNMWLLGDAAITSVDEEVDFSWGAGAIAPTSADSSQPMTGSDYMSVRWSGMFKPELSETYTFFADVDNGARIYVDGTLVVDNWEVSAASEYSATLAATSGLLYEVKLEYRHTTGDAGAIFAYSSPSIAKRPIPSSRLYNTPQHVFGSPFQSYVSPAPTCGTTSHAAGPGLCFATAGHYSAFTIQARDEYQNLRTKWEDTFVVKASHTDHVERAKTGTVGANVVKGKYNVAYIVTQAGSMNVHAALAVNGGIQATYYDGVSATFYDGSAVSYMDYYGPAKSRTDEVIHADNYNSIYGAGTCACTPTGTTSGTPADSTYDACECLGTSLVQDQIWAARWSGLIRPSTAAQYTFGVIGTAHDDAMDRVKLWLDNQLVIDQWNSLAASTPTATYSFPVANDYYELEMEYRAMSLESGKSLTTFSDGSAPSVKLTITQTEVATSNKVLASSYLAQSSDIRASPFGVTVNADVTDWAVSTVTGQALSIASVGVQSQLIITSRDKWGNARSEGGDQYLVHVSTVGGSVFEGTVADNSDGTYTVSYTPGVQGIYDLKMYLGSADKTYTLLVEPGLTCASTSLANGVALTIATAGYAATFTIQAKDSFENIRTGSDVNFVMKMTGPGTEVHKNPFVYIGAGPATNLGRYTVAYRATQSGVFNLDVKMATSGGLKGNYYRDNAFSNLVYTNNDGPSNGFSFNWGTDSPDVAVGIVDDFSVQWTGFINPGASAAEYLFQTVVSGTDDRVKLWIDDQYVVDQWTSLSSTGPTGTLWLVGTNLYDIRLDYKDSTGSSGITLNVDSATVTSSNLFYVADIISGSPFTTTVFPAKTSGTISTATGQGLSLATAGTTATFTIQAKDHLGNPTTTTDDIFVVRARHNNDYTLSNKIGTVTSEGSGRYTVSYTADQKRNSLSCTTLDVTNACATRITDFYEVAGTRGAISATYYVDYVRGPHTNLKYAKHKFHDVLASQAIVGGLHATYYNSVNYEESDTGANDLISLASPELVTITRASQNPYRSRISPTVAQSFPSTNPEMACLNSVDDFLVRYIGFFKPPDATTYSFQALVDSSAGTNERVRVWIDNQLIINQWTSLASTTPSHTSGFQFSSADAYYDITIEYKQDSTSVDAASIDFQYNYNGLGWATVPSSRLYQRYDLSFKIADQMGLTATYYDTYSSAETEFDGLAISGVKAVQESTVDWSGSSSTDRPYPTSVFASTGFMVRWSGFVKPSRTDTYTFFTTLNANDGSSGTTERVILWLDNILLINQWASLAAIEPTGTYAFPIAEDYYNLVMDYKIGTTATRGFQLQWKNNGTERVLFGDPVPPLSEQVAKGVIPADRLFSIRTSTTVERDDFKVWDVSYFDETAPNYNAILEDRELGGTAGQWGKVNGFNILNSGCPSTFGSERYNRCRGQGLRLNEILKVDVKPNVVSPTKSTVSSSDGGLTVSTAGITRTFSLTARDAFDNQRDATDDSFIARALISDYSSSDLPFHGTFEHQDFFTLRDQGETNYHWNVNGKYEATYIITRSGKYTMTVSAADVSGNGLYGTYFSTNGLTGTAVTQTDATINFNWGRSNPTTSTSILAGSFSVRWAGYVKSSQTEVHTFYTNCDYGVRLKVNRVSLIDQWGAAGKEYSATFSMVTNVLYDIILEYQTVGEISYCSLSWSSPSIAKQVIPTTAFRVEAQQISKNDQDTLPTVASGAASSIFGNGLSIATAGITASFTVISKDMYGNMRDSCSDILFARMIPDAPTCTLGSYPYDWVNAAAGDFFTCTSKGKIRMTTTESSALSNQVSTTGNHGAISIPPVFTDGTITYSQGFAKAVPLDFGTNIADTSTTCQPTTYHTGNKHRFQYIQTRAGSQTLYVSESPGGIGTSYLSAAGTGLMATYYETSSFGTPRNAYDCIEMNGEAYSTASCSTAGGAVTFSSNNTDTPFSLVGDGVFSARWTGLVRPSTVVTAYTFQANIGSSSAMDERVKLWIDNSLLIDQWTSIASTQPSATVSSTYMSNNQFYDIKVEYKNVVGGSTDGSYFDLQWSTNGEALATIPTTRLYPSHIISGQSMRVRVNPNVAYSRECEVYGQGLTVATAGLQATFAIQSKDAYNNARGTGGDLFIVRAFSDGCQVIDNSQELKQTCQPYGPAIRTCGNANDANTFDDCPATTNPAPEKNDGGDDDGDWSSGIVSRKPGGGYRTDVTSSLCENCPRIVRGDVVDNGDGTYTASFTGSQKGRYSVVTSLVNSGGLFATYYDSDPVGTASTYSFAGPSADGKKGSVDTTVDWSAGSAGSLPTGSLANAPFGVRWVGFVRPSRASQYTFHSDVKSVSERVKLWVDNSIIIQQWSSLSSQSASGTIGFAKGNGYYDISLLYKCTDNTASCGVSLEYENTAAGATSDKVTRGVIPSDRLFQRYDLPNTGLTCSGTPCITKNTASQDTLHTTLQIMPSVTCASQSTALGDGLSISTAGMAATFTIQSKDAYENTREDTSASFTVDLFGSGGAPIYNGAVSTATSTSGTYTSTFTAENAKTYDLFVKYGSDNIKGSPFTLTIKPGNTCGSKSTIQGTGLTAASISPSKSAFTIQARDQYGNAKTQAIDTSQDYVVRVVRTSGTGMQGTRGLPPFYGSTAISTSPTVHGTFNTATNDGKYAGYYQIPSTPSPSGYTHYLYASWAAVGGLTATYYSTSDGGSTYSAPIDVMTDGTTAAIKRFASTSSYSPFYLTNDGSNQNFMESAAANTLAASSVDFVARFSGLYQTSSTQRYFRMNLVDQTRSNIERVKLWVDNKLIIDQWTSLAAIEATGSYLFDSSSGVYDLHAEFLKTAAASVSSTLSIEDSSTSSSSGYSVIGSDKLYFVEQLSGSPYAVTVSS